MISDTPDPLHLGLPAAGPLHRMIVRQVLDQWPPTHQSMVDLAFDFSASIGVHVKVMSAMILCVHVNVDSQ